MMGAESISETSVNLYQTTRRNNPEYSQTPTPRRENLKFQQIKFLDLMFVLLSRRQEGKRILTSW
jgi:hypothetical protein